MKSGYEFQSEFARSYVAKGWLEGILEAKDSQQDLERVLASTELAELDRWVRRAAVLSDARECLAHAGLAEGAPLP